MSKELAPLEIFYEMKHYLSLEWNDLEDLIIVENALKEREIYKMLCETYIYFINNPKKQYSVYDLGKWIKALEIIKEKLFYIDFKLLLSSTDYETYCFMVMNKKLTKEEYELLKEVLKDEK